MATKAVKSLNELEQLVLSHLQNRPEIAGIRGVKAYLHEPDSTGSNWDIFRFDAGGANAERCQSAICAVTKRLKKEFDATDVEHPATLSILSRQTRTFK